VGRFGLRRVILQLRLLSMDPTMPLKLPRYMFRRANGSFRYKRNVPKDLRTVIPKATVYRQLGNTYQDALWALPKVHAEIDALFDLERRTTDEQRAKELVRERLGERHKSALLQGGHQTCGPRAHRAGAVSFNKVTGRQTACVLTEPR
jgi:hypothetical protein